MSHYYGYCGIVRPTVGPIYSNPELSAVTGGSGHVGGNMGRQMGRHGSVLATFAIEFSSQSGHSRLGSVLLWKLSV